MTPEAQPEAFEPKLTYASAPKPIKTSGRNLAEVIRVSQLHGREGDGFMSPEIQKEINRDYAARNGDRIVTSYEELDESGGTLDREGLQAALADCHAGRVDGLIVANARRFGRTRHASEAAIYKLVEKGISFIAVHEMLDTAGGKKLSRMQEKWLNDTLMNAQWELEDFKAHWADVRRRHIARGAAVNNCYGYRKGDDKKLHEYRPESRWVRFIFRERAKGTTYLDIVDALNKKGAPIPSRHSDKVQASKQWVHQHVTQILNNRTYLGELRRGDAVNLTAHAPIITEDQWRDAHLVVTRGGRITETDEFYVLAGLVRCAACGGRMTGIVQNGKRDWRRRYYRCRGKYPWGDCPQSFMVPADELEAEVATFIERNVIDKTTLSSARLNRKLDEAVAAVAEAKAELEAYALSIKASVDALGGDSSAFQAGLDDRTDKLLAARAEEDEAREAAVGVTLPADLRDEWPKMTNPERAVIYNRLIHCVAVKPPKIIGEPEPVRPRMKVFILGSRTAPKDLPGRRIGPKPRGAPKKESTITRIRF